VNTPKEPARRRLSAEESKQRILSVAERHLARVGPAGLRLKELSAELGISHPAILHHFGSREGLVNAVVERALSTFEQRLSDMLSARAASPDALMDALAEFFSEGDRARLFAWLNLSGGRGESDAPRPYERIAQRLHDARTDANAPSYEDTLFRVQLAALALFAEALFGSAIRRTLGQRDDAEASLDFRRRLARLLSTPPQ